MTHKLLRFFAAFLFASVTCVAASAADFPLVGDASVNSTHTSTTAGTVSNLYVSSANNTFLQFDSTQVPTGTTASQVSKATLLVFVNRVNTAGTVTVSLLSSAFAEGTVTYASQPTIGTSQGTFTTTASSAGQYVAIDVTAAVKGWITTPSSNYGLALTSTAADIVLDSKENDQTAHPARLDVTFAPSTLAAGTTTGQLYLTGTSGALPTAPVSISGDATLGSTGVLAIASTAGTDIVTAINAGSSVIGASKLGTSSGTATTFLNGSGAFAAPIVLTTTGTSGAATLSGNTLNIPTPSAGGGVTSVSTSSGNATPSATISGTALTINFPTSGVVTASATTSGTTGTVTVSGSNLAINFPVSSSLPVADLLTNFSDGAAANTTANTNVYFSPSSTNAAEAATPVPFTSAVQVPAACVVQNLTVTAVTAYTGNTGGGTATITVVTESNVGNNTLSSATTTALTCTTGAIANTAGSVTTCSDTTDKVSVSAGRYLSLALKETLPGGNTAYPAAYFSVHFVCQ